MRRGWKCDRERKTTCEAKSYPQHEGVAVGRATRGTNDERTKDMIQPLCSMSHQATNPDAEKVSYTRGQFRSFLHRARIPPRPFDFLRCFPKAFRTKSRSTRLIYKSSTRYSSYLPVRTLAEHPQRAEVVNRWPRALMRPGRIQVLLLSVIGPHAQRCRPGRAG